MSKNLKCEHWLQILIISLTLFLFPLAMLIRCACKHFHVLACKGANQCIVDGYQNRKVNEINRAYWNIRLRKTQFNAL